MIKKKIDLFLLLKNFFRQKVSLFFAKFKYSSHIKIYKIIPFFFEKNRAEPNFLITKFARLSKGEFYKFTVYN